MVVVCVASTESGVGIVAPAIRFAGGPHQGAGEIRPSRDRRNARSRAPSPYVLGRYLVITPLTETQCAAGVETPALDRPGGRNGTSMGIARRDRDHAGQATDV